MRLGDVAVYIASKMVPSVLGFATMMLLTWLLTPEQFGIYGLGLAAVAIGNNLLFDWISVSFQRWYQGREADLTFMATLLALFAGACAVSVVLTAAASLLGLLAPHGGYVWLFLAGAWAYGWFEFAARIQAGRFRPWRYFAMNLVRSGLILVGCTAAAYLTRSADVVLGASFMAMFLSGCLFLGDGSIRRGGRADAVLARSFVAYAAPLGFTMVLYGLSNSANRLLLGWLSTVESVAHYTVASALVQNSAGLLAVGIGTAAWPGVIKAVDSGDPARAAAMLGRTHTLLLGLLVPAGVGLTLVVPQVAGLLISPGYREPVVALTPWLALSSGMLGFRAQYVDFSFQLGRKTRLAVQVTAMSAALNVGLNVALIPRWGALGSAVALTIACGVSLMHALWLARRSYPLPLPGLETAKVAAAVALMAGVMMVAGPWPGVAGLAARIALGAAAYATGLAALDVLGLRQALRPWLIRGGAVIRGLPERPG